MPKPILPKGWKEVSLEQFIELRQLKAEDGAFNHNIDILCALTDAIPDDFDDLDIAEVAEIFKDLIDIFHVMYLSMACITCLTSA